MKASRWKTSPSLAIAHDLSDGQEVRIEAAVLVDDGSASSALSGGEHPVGVLDRECEGLLDDDVLAGCHDPVGPVSVRVWGSGDNDDVERVVGQELRWDRTVVVTPGNSWWASSSRSVERSQRAPSCMPGSACAARACSAPIAPNPSSPTRSGAISSGSIPRARRSARWSRRATASTSSGLSGAGLERKAANVGLGVPGHDRVCGQAQLGCRPHLDSLPDLLQRQDRGVTSNGSPSGETR